MQVKLAFGDIAHINFREYDPEFDNVQSILIDMCEAFSDAASFSVSGFGQSEWPVDVHTDLPVFLEQLPDAITLLRKSANAEIDFYEQGLERKLEFEPSSEWCIVRCTSLTMWEPQPATEKMSRFEVIRMMQVARDEFMRALSRADASLATHPWITRWRAGSA